MTSGDSRRERRALAVADIKSWHCLHPVLSITSTHYKHRTSLLILGRHFLKVNCLWLAVSVEKEVMVSFSSLVPGKMQWAPHHPGAHHVRRQCPRHTNLLPSPLAPLAPPLFVARSHLRLPRRHLQSDLPHPPFLSGQPPPQPLQQKRTLRFNHPLSFSMSRRPL